MSKILVAEDNPGTADMLEALLELEGYEVITTGSPDAVIPLMTEERPDILLIDFHLGQRSSTSILRAIRKDPILQHLPIIVVSGMECGWEAEKAGANSFLLKPFSVDSLLAELREHLGDPQQHETAP